MVPVVQRAQAVRQRLTGERRLLRIYGSEAVLGRLTGEGSRVRLHLLNCSRRKIVRLRVRILGACRKAAVYAEGIESAPAADCSVEPPAKEFTTPEMGVYAIMDLE